MPSIGIPTLHVMPFWKPQGSSRLSEATRSTPTALSHTVPAYVPACLNVDRSTREP